MTATGNTPNPAVLRTHEYEIVCSCGHRWRLDAQAEAGHVECPECGARTAEAVDLGQMRPR